MKFNEILRELRQEKGLSQKGLAEKIGYSKTIIGEWEVAKKQPTADAIIAISDFFGVKTDYLLGLEDSGGARTIINGGYNQFGGTNNQININKRNTEKIKKIHQLAGEILEEE